MRKQILSVWPDIGQSTDDQVRIFVGLKLYGYRIEDIDLLVVGHLAKPRSFDIEFKFHPRDSAPFIPRYAVCPELHPRYRSKIPRRLRR